MSQDTPGPDEHHEPVEPAPKHHHRWRPWMITVDVVAVLAVVGAVGAWSGWFDGGSGDQADSAVLVRSSPRALTAEVQTHLPSDVTVLWSTGHGAWGRLMPDGPDGLHGTLSTMLLLRSHGHQYLLNVVTSRSSEDSRAMPDTAVPKTDGQGRLVSETVSGSTAAATTVAVEITGPGGAGALPLSEDALKELVADPLIGPRTTPQVLRKATNVAGFTMSPPPIRWPYDPI